MNELLDTHHSVQTTRDDPRSDFPRSRLPKVEMPCDRGSRHLPNLIPDLPHSSAPVPLGNRMRTDCRLPVRQLSGEGVKVGRRATNLSCGQLRDG